MTFKDYVDFVNDHGVQLGDDATEVTFQEPSNRLKKELNYIIGMTAIQNNNDAIAWRSSESYEIGELVSSGGKNWISLTAHTNITPVEGANWTEVDSVYFKADTSIKVLAADIEATVVDGDVVYFNDVSGDYEKASTTETSKIVGIINVTDGVIDTTGLIEHSSYSGFSAGTLLSLHDTTAGVLTDASGPNGTSTIVAVALGNNKVSLSYSLNAGEVQSQLDDRYTKAETDAGFVKDTVTWTTGADNITKSGFYSISTDYTNLPVALASHLIHEQWDGDANYARQTVQSRQSTYNVYSRLKIGGSWGSWVQVMQDEAKDFSTAGYQKMSNGLIIQWASGQMATDPGYANTLPIAFPNACLSATANHNGGSVQAVTVNASTTTITIEANASGGAFYIAIGY